MLNDVIDEIYPEMIELWFEETKFQTIDTFTPCNGQHCGPCGDFRWPCTLLEYPENTFEYECDQKMCGAWGTHTSDDEFLGGYYKLKGYESQNAYDLTREYNIYRLSCLPYPRQVLIATIDCHISPLWICYPLSIAICESVCKKYFETTGKHLPLVKGTPNPLNEREFIVKKKYNTINYINKQLLFLDKLPKYIKMEILEPHTELTFWQLYNL